MKNDISDIIIENYSINGLSIGSPAQKIYEIMGEPDFPVGKLNKKSKLLYWSYGNITFLTENNCIVAIDIDLHSNKKEIVCLDKILNWKLENWLTWAKKHEFCIQNVSDIIKIVGSNIIFSLSQKGKLGMISIR